MLEKPPIEEEKIAISLLRSYGLTVTDIEFLPRGYDTNAAVYRVQADRQAYFLKVRWGAVDAVTIALARYLKTSGFDQIVAPLPTITGERWADLDGLALLLYPFIVEKPHTSDRLSDDHWIAFGAFMRRLHEAQLPADLRKQIPGETFIPLPRAMEMLRQMHETVIHRSYENPIQRDLAEFWKDHYQDIGLIMDRSEQLGQVLRNRSPEFVLCHADVHTGNLMIDAQNGLHVVDWDQPILAPIERDLMFVTVGGFVSDPREESLFFQGYGPASIDPLTMAYYRYERTMEDISDFGARVFLMDNGDETRRDSVYWFTVQFDPGNTLEAAHKLYQELRF